MEKNKNCSKDKNVNPFEVYRKEIAETIEKTKLKIKTDQKRDYFNLNDCPVELIRQELISIIKQIFNISESTLNELCLLDEPPAHIHQDLAFSTFIIANDLKKKPEVIAEIITKKINNRKNYKFIKTAKSIGAFVNLNLDQKKLYSRVLLTIDLLKEKYGESDINAGKIALFDYSAPNIAKPIGVGHLRSTIIGQALTNIYQKTGFAVIRDNHLGDWGTQFGELIYGYQEWGEEEKIAKNPLTELKNLYVRFHKEVEKKPEIKERARELFKGLEEKNPTLISLWKQFRDLSIDGFKKVYERLGIKFDTYIGESYFTDQTDSVIKECLNKKLAKTETDTKVVIVDTLKKLPSFILRKEDGSSLYITRDLATLKFRINTFKPSVIIYVVGEEQELYFKQLFELSKAIGLLNSEIIARHVKFGMVLSDGKKMSTRRGTTIELEELIKQSIDKSKKILIQKNNNLKPKKVKEISEIIGVGAIIYNDLKQSRIQNISFDWQKMLDFTGGSAVYLQYTYARINSIIKRVEGSLGKNKKEKPMVNLLFEDKTEFDLIKKLMFFPSVIIKALNFNSPHFICGYLENLAQLFNIFYEKVSIIKTTNLDLQKSRIKLIKSVALVIKNGLSLLNIKTPDRI